MASNYHDTDDPQDQEESYNSESSDWVFSSTEEDSSGSEDESHKRRTSHSPAPNRQPCQHYNKGNCKYGSKCRDLHICKYFFRGECRYGSSCRLSHVKVSGSESSSDEERSGKQRQRRRRRRSTSSIERDSRFEGPFRWQINDGSGWKDIANDHIIEAQYSKPTTKGMTIYNTRFGAISIDFKKMKVQKKHSLRVRRQSSAEVTWVWYYSGNHGWVQFGETDSKGKSKAVKSTDIEKEFQKNQKGSYTFSTDLANYKIEFKDMLQENLCTGHKRRVIRRPKFINLCSAVQGLSLSSGQQNLVWQFKGNAGKWHIFRNRQGTNTECSVSSADIEAKYQQNPSGSMIFTVNDQRYKLDFPGMIQTNLTTGKTRRVRRVPQ